MSPASLRPTGTGRNAGWPAQPAVCTTGRATMSGRAYLDLARPKFGPLGNAYREHALLEVRLDRSSIHCDLPRPRGLATLDRDLEHPVAVLRVDPVRVHVIGQGDHAPELPIEPFLPIVVGCLVDGHLAVSGHREQVLLDGD